MVKPVILGHGFQRDLNDGHFGISGGGVFRPGNEGHPAFGRIDHPRSIGFDLAVRREIELIILTRSQIVPVDQNGQRTEFPAVMLIKKNDGKTDETA